jgi:hypothetical protein
MDLAAAGPEVPAVLDTRPDGHNSFSVLPKLGTDEFYRLRDFYKFEWLTQYGYDQASDGQLYVALWAIELKAGPAIVQPRVFDATEAPLSGALVWFSWPGAESLPAEATPRYKSTGVYGWTDATGSCGWAYNGDAHIGDDGGPFSVWVNAGGAGDQLSGSDALTKIGFWDDHITPNPWLIIRRKGDGVDPVGKLRIAAIDPDGNVIGWTNLTDTLPTGTGGFAVIDENDNDLGFAAWDS